MSRYFLNTKRPESPQWSGEEFSFLENDEIADFHRSLEGYEPTPLVSLPRAASHLGVGEICVKDESQRFGVKAFKPLGASYAIYRLLKEQWEERFDKPFSPETFGDAGLMSKLGAYTFCAASDGNHGKAVAWTARKLGQKAVIYMPYGTARSRIERIEAEGAKVVVVRGSYDDCVEVAEEDAAKNGWHAVSDTAYEGNVTVPTWVLQGYSTLYRETEPELHSESGAKVDIVFLQAGVGAFAAAGALYYNDKYGRSAPKLVCVEPLEAAGFLDSMVYGGGTAIAARGRLETIMAGLNCGLPSRVAWPVLRDTVSVFLAIPDRYAEDAMRLFSASGIVSGESGASGLAGLIALARDRSLEEAKEFLGLDESTRVLVINTEGDTDPENYARIVQASNNE